MIRLALFVEINLKSMTLWFSWSYLNCCSNHCVTKFISPPLPTVNGPVENSWLTRKMYLQWHHNADSPSVVQLEPFYHTLRMTSVSRFREFLQAIASQESLFWPEVVFSISMISLTVCSQSTTCVTTVLLPPDQSLSLSQILTRNQLRNPTFQQKCCSRRNPPISHHQATRWNSLWNRLAFVLSKSNKVLSMGQSYYLVNQSRTTPMFAQTEKC